MKKGFKAGETEYKVHIDGFNLLPYLMGEVEHSPRRGFFYFNDDAELVAMRFENWKIVFAEQRCQGTLRIWAEPFTTLRVPSCSTCAPTPMNTPTSHRIPTTTGCCRRLLRLLRDRNGGEFLDTFKEFPPRHPPASFSIDQIVKKLEDFLAGRNPRPRNSRKELRMPDSQAEHPRHLG